LCGFLGLRKALFPPPLCLAFLQQKRFRTTSLLHFHQWGSPQSCIFQFVFSHILLVPFSIPIPHVGLFPSCAAQAPSWVTPQALCGNLFPLIFFSGFTPSGRQVFCNVPLAFQAEKLPSLILSLLISRGPPPLE